MDVTMPEIMRLSRVTLDGMRRSIPDRGLRYATVIDALKGAITLKRRSTLEQE